MGAFFHPGTWETLAITGLWPRATWLTREMITSSRRWGWPSCKTQHAESPWDQAGLVVTGAQMCRCPLGHLCSSVLRKVSHECSPQHQTTVWALCSAVTLKEVSIEGAARRQIPFILICHLFWFNLTFSSFSLQTSLNITFIARCILILAAPTHPVMM